MHCPICGTSLSQNASFCPTCGKLMNTSGGEAEGLDRAKTLPPISPYDPYHSQPTPATYYGTQVPVADKQYPSSPLTLSPPPPPRRRSSRGLTGIFIGIIVILLVSVGLGGWLLHKQSALASHSIKPTATPQLTHATPTATANTLFQSLPGMWTQCAVENATCTLNGTRTVAFGANGSFYYANESNAVACSVSIFGDPLQGTIKACYSEIVPSTTNAWVQCAAENATCAFTGKMTVAFGANGSYKYATETNGVACTTGVFGDPAYGVAKACYLISSPNSTTTWTLCATQNSTCSFSGTHEVAYGADGAYVYGSFTNGTACSDTAFGNPISNIVQSCYYQ